MNDQTDHLIAMTATLAEAVSTLKTKVARLEALAFGLVLGMAGWGASLVLAGAAP